MKKGVLLVNLGTPDEPNTRAVRRYLREFLMDARVLDIPFLQRWLLVQGVIAPLRAPKSAHIYQKLWTPQGSPLMIYGKAVQELLQQKLGSDYHVALAMRYQNPSLVSVLRQLKSMNLEEIIILPLFPQYASASTGSVLEKVMEEIKSWGEIPPIRTISTYCNHEGFIQAFAHIGKLYLEKETYDHIIFSYHGIPERQITKHNESKSCLASSSCCEVYGTHNRLCYRAQCFETTRKLAATLGLDSSSYSVSFQSRLGKTPWIKPYTDDLIRELAKAGKKRLLVFSPSFVSDCLETTVEIGMEYKELFESLGGTHLQLVESLNKHPLWISALTELVLDTNTVSSTQIV